MSKKGVIGFSSTVLVLGMAPLAMAAGGEAQAAGMWTIFGIAIASGFGIAIAAFGTGIAMGYAVNGALMGTARNPEAGGKIMTNMIIGLALIEALCIYTLLICLLLSGKIPNMGPFMDAIVKSIGA